MATRLLGARKVQAGLRRRIGLADVSRVIESVTYACRARPPTRRQDSRTFPCADRVHSDDGTGEHVHTPAGALPGLRAATRYGGPPRQVPVMARTGHTARTAHQGLGRFDRSRLPVRYPPGYKDRQVRYPYGYSRWGSHEP
ncbi:hypothetical protein GCM10010106_02370 [Thermopolyspora flexuosa]|nr:hypothetical protein GCM10010106_02370 [Thermopolyspora flexuosa]